METGQVVFVVDDDRLILDLLEAWLKDAGLRVRAFDSAEEFLGRFRPDWSGCVLADVLMPGMCGLRLQRALIAAGARLPLILMSGQGDVPTVLSALEHGAFSFVEKPFDPLQLLQLVQRALEYDRQSRLREAHRSAFHSRLASLTPREREVMEKLADGATLKQIGAEFQVSSQTASRHRMAVLEKMGVRNDVELARLVLAHRPGNVLQPAAQ